jgi:hypothetical protein
MMRSSLPTSNIGILGKPGRRLFLRWESAKAMITLLMAEFATLVVLKYKSLVRRVYRLSFASSRFAALCCFAEGRQEAACEVGERGVPKAVTGTGQRTTLQRTVLEYSFPTLKAPGASAGTHDPVHTKEL